MIIILINILIKDSKCFIFYIILYYIYSHIYIVIYIIKNEYKEVDTFRDK